MRWPWQQKRSASENVGGGAIIHRPALDDELLPSPLRVADVGYVEAGVRLIADCLAACEVRNGPDAVDAAFLHCLARHLMLRGEALFLINTESGMIKLNQSSSWTVSGQSPEPMEWLYREITTAGPDADATHNEVAAGVLHFRINQTAERPDRGRSPLLLSRKTAELATLVETRLVEESKASTGQLLSLTLPMGADDGPGQYEQAYKRLGKLAGSTFIERQSMPDGASRQNFVGRMRAGPEYHANQIGLRREIRADIASALGTPPELLGLAGSLPSRESYRIFILTRIASLAAVIQSELRMKLDAPMLQLDTARLVGRDLTNTARAIKSLTDAGVPLDQATAICGVMNDAG